jgi:hypothetical protein
MNCKASYQLGGLISIRDTTANIRVTVIVPVDLSVQNAQICASALSGGSQSCQQLVVDPIQRSFTFVNVDLSQPTPTFTSASESH